MDFHCLFLRWTPATAAPGTSSAENARSHNRHSVTPAPPDATATLAAPDTARALRAVAPGPDTSAPGGDVARRTRRPAVCATWCRLGARERRPGSPDWVAADGFNRRRLLGRDNTSPSSTAWRRWAAAPWWYPPVSVAPVKGIEADGDY